MSDVTTPANPTDQIAATPAVLSPEPPIVPTSGTKRVPDDTNPAVVQDAQQYDWGYDEGNGDEACFTLIRDDGLNLHTEVMVFGDTARYLYALIIQRDSYAAQIKRLEAERDAAVDFREDFDCRQLKAERDALLAEHEAWTAWRTGKPSTSRKDWNRLTNAHHNAERVIRGE